MIQFFISFHQFYLSVRLLILFLSFFSVMKGHERTYTEPQEVATTEGLPSSLVYGSVCAITGDYIISALDIVIPGPEPLSLSRIYTSSSRELPWTFNHYDRLVIGEVSYEHKAAALISFCQPSGSRFDYVFKFKKKQENAKRRVFDLIYPKGLTNGASLLSGKTNVKNHKLSYFPDEDKIVFRTGAGNKKIFKIKDKKTNIFGQVSEEKINGSCLRYKGKTKGISGAEEIICENQNNKQLYSKINFSETEIKKDLHLQTAATSDGRELAYYFRRHHYHVTEKGKDWQRSYPVEHFYLSKVDHPYAPAEEYKYEQRGGSEDQHITCKSRDQGRRFLNIDYYHKGDNFVGKEIGNVRIEEDDFRLDRVKKLAAPVGAGREAITTHLFDYHATIKESKNGRKWIENGYTDVYDAKSHKTRYKYDEEHRLTAIIRYSGTDADSYIPYSKECFIWDKEGALIAKVLKDGNNQIHHARTFKYDAYGNVEKSILCGKLTGRSSSPVEIDDNGKITSQCEQEVKTYTYSQDGLNLLLSETDSAGKTILYDYQEGTDLLKAKYLSYIGEIRQREFYFYDENNVLERKSVDDGRHLGILDSSYVTRKLITLITPQKQAPIGLPECVEEWGEKLFPPQRILLKRTHNTYSRYGKLIKQDVFDSNGILAYTLNWDYDLHGNLISETDACGYTTRYIYDQATDNLISKSFSNVEINHEYDFADRLIEQKEIHPDEKFTTLQEFDYLSNCIGTTNAYGHKTERIFDPLGRLVKTKRPAVVKDGMLTHPIEKKEYDIAGFPVAVTDANGQVTRYAVNIRGQPTKISYPDGTVEEMLYSLEGWLMERTAINGTKTCYKRDPLGRVISETVYGGDQSKETLYVYDALYLLSTTDPEGNLTTYSYDAGGRLKETVKNRIKTEQFYDALGRLSEIREHYGEGPQDYRSTCKKYDLLDRITEETIQNSEGKTLHFTSYAYDERGNQTFIQVGDQKTFIVYNTRNQPTLIQDGLGHETHITYDSHFINAQGQRVLQKTTTDPLGYRTLETYDTADRLVERLRFNPIGQKVARQWFSYDLVGNQTKSEEEVIENGQVIRILKTHFFYNAMNQLTKTIEAEGTPEQRSSSIDYNAFGKQEFLHKPDGKWIRYTYDLFGRLKTCSASDFTIDYLYQYDRLDRITAVTDKITGKSTIRKYFQEELKKEILANDLSIDYTYDRTGRPLKLTFPDQSGMEYIYNAADLKKIHRLVNSKCDYIHCDLIHSLSGRITKAHPPGRYGHIDYRFDALDRCTAIESPAFRQQIPFDGFDHAGNLLKCETQSIACSFAYDDHYQIRKETGHASHFYSFDSVANRTKKDGEVYRHNALNQLVANGENLLTYDRNGNLKRNGPYEYSYDLLDRLIKVTGKGTVTTYAYDAFDRRISKKINDEEELFLYQGQDEIGCWKNGVCQELRLLGSNPSNRTVAIEIKGLRYVPLHDMRGNITALVDFEGNVIERYRYTAFGEREIFSPSGEKRLQSEIGNPWQYAGKRFDEETGLVAFGMRYYDPALGRWTTPDPAGFIDGANLYAYVYNNPLLYVDQYGLFSESLLNFEWKSTISSYYHSAETAFIDAWNSPRFQGGMQAAGGLAEASIGAGMTYATGGLAVPAGSAVMAHGLDHFFTGINTVWTGQHSETVTSQLLHKTGLSTQTANLFDNGLSMGGIAAGAKVMASAPGFIRSQALKSSGNFGVNEVEFITKEGMPCLDKLSKAGQVMDRGGLTKAGRALEKHGGRPGSVFPKPSGNTARINQYGQNIVDNILTHPISVVHFRTHKQFGQILDIKVPNIGGVRFTKNYEMIGFLEP